MFSFSAASPASHKQPPQVRSVPENAGPFHRFGSVGTWWHCAGCFQGGQRLGLQIESAPRVLDRPGHGI